MVFEIRTSLSLALLLSNMEDQFGIQSNGVQPHQSAEESKRTKMYWHRVYGEPITVDFLNQWPEDQMPYISLVGEFTEEEWRDFISTAHRDENGALIMPDPPSETI